MDKIYPIIIGNDWRNNLSQLLSGMFFVKATLYQPLSWMKLIPDSSSTIPIGVGRAGVSP